MVHKGKTLIFLHIPKAAGSTLATVLERQFPQKSIYNIRGHEVQKSINEFINLSEDNRRNIKCLRGHMSFGLHRYFLQSSTYITLLRDPVERIISHYSYVLRTPTHYLHSIVTSNNLGLKEYVSREMSPELSNGQVRLISGIESVDSITGDNPVSDEILEIAKGNLRDYFAVVGISERFDESLILLKRILGWRQVFYTKRNVAGIRPSVYEVYDRETIEMIESINRYDLELYKYGKKMFERLVKEQDMSFEKEVKRFQLLNKYYYPSSPHRLFYKIKRGRNYLLRRIAR